MIFRNDAYAKVTGRAQYADDFVFPRMVHCVPVYSEHIHARILNISTAAAEKSPGVLRVITWKDVPGNLKHGQITRDMPLLAYDKIRYWGDVYALVVAETRDQALAAAFLVSLEAEKLDGVFDPEEALRDGAPLVHEHLKSNQVCHHKIRKGNADSVLNKCAVVVEKEFTTGFFEHAYLEPEGAVCHPRQDGVFEVFGSFQHPVSTRRFICAYLGKRFSEVEVFSNPTGGSFGGKDDTASLIGARTVLASMLVRRAVKTRYSREWSMQESYKRPPYRLHYHVGFTEQGEMKATKCRIIADSGAYTSTTPWSTWRSTVQCCGPYHVEHVHADVIAAFTNNIYTGAFRGFGSPQVNFAIEQIMDIAAERLAIDPVEIRRTNMVVQGSSTITGQVLDNHTVSTEEVLSNVLNSIDFASKLPRCSYGKGDKHYGIGFALAYRGASVGAEAKDFCSCIINCQFDGSIILETGIHENGQGAQSAMMLVLSRELGVDLDRIRYTEPTTSQVPDGGTTVASRGTLMGSGAVLDGVKRLKKILANTLHPVLNCKPEEVVFGNDCISAGEGKKTLTWDQAMEEMYNYRVYPFAFGSFKAPDVDWDEETGQGNAYFTYVYSCQAAEVEVNRSTGKVKLLNIVASHDIGNAVNPGLLKGQVYGGITQGAGMTLYENFRMEQGIPVTLNYNSYRIPKAADMPEMEVFIVENRDPTSPAGCKGIGEPALELIAPAIANAVYRATGKRYNTLPLHLEPLQREKAE